MLKNKKIKIALSEYDILFIHETHCTLEMEFHIDNFKAFNNPCTLSSSERPRGGCIMFVKNHLMKYVTCVDKNFNDSIIVYIMKNTVICGFYIPPDTSKYFDCQMELLETLSVYDKTDPRKILICGDLNSRIGVVDSLNGEVYQPNPDVAMNQHGRRLLNICESNNLVPLNMLIKNQKKFRGGFTFHRGNLKSQNDWIICSKNIINCASEFDFIDNMFDLSDHIPIFATMKLEVDTELDFLCDNIQCMLDEKNNHSRYKKFRMENIDENVFINTMKAYICDIEKIDYKDGNTLATDIDQSLRKAASIASKKRIIPVIPEVELPDNSFKESVKNDATVEYNTWNELLREKDPKRVWNKIDFNGKCKTDNIVPENTCNEFADYLEKRCSLPAEHMNFEGIKSQVYQPDLDGPITGTEVLDAAKDMNKQSSSKCGIPLPLLLAVINLILGTVVNLFNKVFTAKYPSSWVPFICCLPKKMKLNIPFVRGISLKAILAKLYDAVIKNRLEKWLKIPEEQTAYQKKKNCALHVFFVRCLISICKKMKISLFIGVTDFEAAFDYISRRNLFIKLARLGIGMILLKALMAMYMMTDAYVFLNGEYSRKLNITAGVLQGSASSTLLFMAYTSDIIQLFRNTFPAEELLQFYHILLHADDSLILAASKDSLIRKFIKLAEYCKENNIKLQLGKCCFLVINSRNITDKADIVIGDDVIVNKNNFIYLGCIITDAGNVTTDVKTEIEKKEKKLNQFIAFLTQNKNAPLAVKEWVLDSCIVSTVLYNCETWGNANLSHLEKKYRKALKYMLGVRRSTINEFPYIELGKPTLASMVHKRQLKFYRQCFEHDRPMQRYIIQKALDVNSSFIKHYTDLNTKYKNPEDITAESMTELRNMVLRKGESSNKYKSFLVMNPSLSRPTLYSTYIPTDKLHAVSHLRLVSHNLAVETGRHFNVVIPRNERLCSCGDMEDEIHFLLHCHHYSHVRLKYFYPDTPLSIMLDNPNTPEYIQELNQLRKLYR